MEIEIEDKNIDQMLFKTDNSQAVYIPVNEAFPNQYLYLCEIQLPFLFFISYSINFKRFLFKLCISTFWGHISKLYKGTSSLNE